MKLKLLPFLSAAILAMASTVASADPIVIGAQVPGSDPSSEPCTPKERTDDYHKNHFSADISGSTRRRASPLSVTGTWLRFKDMSDRSHSLP